MKKCWNESEFRVKPFTISILVLVNGNTEIAHKLVPSVTESLGLKRETDDTRFRRPICSSTSPNETTVVCCTLEGVARGPESTKSLSF